MKTRHRIAATLATLLLTGAGCLGVGGGPQVQQMTLEYWRPGNNSEAMDAVIEAYQKLHPNVTISYKQIREDQYETQLLEALAEDRGPDLFSIPNVWMRDWREKLLPAPETITVPTREVNEDQKIVTVNRSTKTPTQAEIIRDYVEAAVTDAILTTPPASRDDAPKKELYGLPLSMDTPILFINADILKRAGITEPPTTWRQLQDMMPQLTLKNTDGTLRQSGVALGLAENVNHATDILATLMMQNGAVMFSEYGRASFNLHTPASRGKVLSPGAEALIFYQGFAEPTATNYSWNDTMPLALDAFISGTTAFYFGYPSEIATVRERAPRLNLQLAPMPLVSLSRKVVAAKYPMEVVSKKTAHPNEAWDFLLFMTQPEQAASYLAAAKRPAALRALIKDQESDADIAAAISQVLYAKSWYPGTAYAKVEEIFGLMILRKPDERRPTYGPILQDAANAVDAAG